jgi:hypothetical protein
MKNKELQDYSLKQRILHDPLPEIDIPDYEARKKIKLALIGVGILGIVQVMQLLHLVQ